MYKQVILLRSDLKLPLGKACSQSSHASVDAVLKSKKTIIKDWKNQGMAKIVLKVKNKEELLKYIQIAKDQGLTTAIITDAGRTIVEPGTMTCGAIGPDKEKEIDKVTGELKLIS